MKNGQSEKRCPNCGSPHPLMQVMDLGGPEPIQVPRREVEVEFLCLNNFHFEPTEADDE